MEREEGVVGEEAVAARSCHEVAAEGGVEAVTAVQHRWRPVHQLVHVAAHAVQRQVVCHLGTGLPLSALWNTRSTSMLGPPNRRKSMLCITDASSSVASTVRHGTWYWAQFVVMAFQEQLRAPPRFLEGVDALVMRKLEMYEDHLEDKDEGIGVGVLVLLAVHELIQRRHGGRPLQQHWLHPMRKAEMRSIRRDGLVLWILVQNLCRSHATIFITKQKCKDRKKHLPDP